MPNGPDDRHVALPLSRMRDRLDRPLGIARRPAGREDPLNRVTDRELHRGFVGVLVSLELAIDEQWGDDDIRFLVVRLGEIYAALSRRAGGPCAVVDEGEPLDAAAVADRLVELACRVAEGRGLW